MIDARHENKRGLIWLGSATALSRALDVAGTVIAMALISREAMGSAALVLSVGEVVEAASGGGLGHAVIRKQDLSDDEQHSLFWVSSALGLGLALVLTLLSPLLAWSYGTPALLAMGIATGAKHVLLGAALVPHQLLSRKLAFREVGAVQTLCSLGVSTTKIAFAAAGFGAWALVLSNVMRGVILVLAAFWFSGFRPRLHFRWQEVREPLNFGVRITGSSLMQQAYRNADYFLVGRFLGIEVLGVYSVAYEIGMQPLEVLSNLVNRVAYPIYARVAAKASELHAALLRSVRVLALIGLPIATFTTFTAHDLSALIAPGRWNAAAPAVQVLAWASLLRGLAQLFPQVYLATGRARLVLIDATLSGLSLIAALLLGLTVFPDLGLIVAPIAWALSYPGLLLLHIVLVRKLVPLHTRGLLKAVAPGLGGAAVVAAGLSLARQIVPALPALPALLVGVGVSLASYLVYLRVVLRVGLASLRPRTQLLVNPPSQG